MWGKSVSTVVRPAVRHQACSGRRAYGVTTRPLQQAAAALKSSAPEPVSFDQPQAVADDRRVAVRWSPDQQSRFHHIWLRDHCRCPECFHPITKQRMHNTFAIPPDLVPRAVHSTEEGLRITWPTGADDHTSLYPWNWLKSNSYDPQRPPTKPDWQVPILWDAEKMKGAMPEVLYDEVMTDDMALYEFLVKINKWGACFVKGVPPNMEGTERLSTRIAFIRETQYGKMWSFTSDLKHGDTAYTNIALPAHTDNTYFTDPAGLQIFHLLHHSQGEGGATLLIDGFEAARQMKERHPDSYNLLCRVPIPCHAAGDTDNFYRPNPETGYPVFSLDPWTGELRHVRWNNDDRSVVKLPPDLMLKWYAAIRDWNACLSKEKNRFWVKMEPGNVVVIDNQRILHGRATFTGKRQVCGAYLGKDDFLSKLRVLDERYGAAAVERLEGDTPMTFNKSAPSDSIPTEQLRSVWAPGL